MLLVKGQAPQVTIGRWRNSDSHSLDSSKLKAIKTSWCKNIRKNPYQNIGIDSKASNSLKLLGVTESEVHVKYLLYHRYALEHTGINSIYILPSLHAEIVLKNERNAMLFLAFLPCPSPLPSHCLLLSFPASLHPPPSDMVGTGAFTSVRSWPSHFFFIGQ